MELLAEFSDKEFGLDTPIPEKYQVRRSASAVLFNSDGRVAMEHATKRQYYKLPGGTMVAGESVEQGLRREVLEETGCEILIGKPIGLVIESRDRRATTKITYCFIATVIGAPENRNLDEYEVEEGFETVWVPINEAIRLLENEPQGQMDEQHYDAMFRAARETLLLKKAKEII